MGAQMQRGAYSRVPGLRRRNAQLRWAMRGQDPPCYFMSAWKDSMERYFAEAWGGKAELDFER